MEHTEISSATDHVARTNSQQEDFAYEPMLGDVPLAALLIDESGQIIDASPSFCAISGYGSVFNLLGRRWGEFVHSNDLKSIIKLLRYQHHDPVEFPETHGFLFIDRFGKSYPAALKIMDWQEHKLIVFTPVEKRSGNNDCYEFLSRMTSSIVQSMIIRDLALVKHQTEVAGLAGKIGIALGLSTKERAVVESAAMIHDIGFIGLESPAADSNSHHAVSGYEILKNIRPLGSVADIVLLHHGPAIVTNPVATREPVVLAARVVACAEYLCSERKTRQTLNSRASDSKQDIALNVWLGDLLDVGIASLGKMNRQ